MVNTLTDVPGFKVGHATHTQAATGCSVVICPPGTVGGVDVRGGAPGTRETDLLRPENHVEEVSAVVLSGGSAYGLAAATGVMSYLEAHELGYVSGSGHRVPIVPAAILFDLAIGDASVRPDAAMGYAACEAATADEVAQGSVGAGTGAVCGMMNGKAYATKGGIGSHSIDLGDGLIVGALVAVNAVGDVVDDDGRILAGVRAPDGGFVGMLNALRSVAHQQDLRAGDRENTVIGIVATNATLNKAQVTKVASMAQNGIARTIRPAHTMFDGDTLFALASGQKTSNPTVIGAFAAEAVAVAVQNAIKYATALDGVQAWQDRT